MDKHFLFPASVCFELLVQKQTDINKIKCTCKQEIRVVLKHKLLDLIGKQTPELFKRNPPLQKRIINHSLLCLPYATHFKVKPERTRLPRVETVPEVTRENKSKQTESLNKCAHTDPKHLCIQKPQRKKTTHLQSTPIHNFIHSESFLDKSFYSGSEILISKQK